MNDYELETELVPEGCPLKINESLLLTLISPAYIQSVIDDAHSNGIIEVVNGQYRFTRDYDFLLSLQ